MAGVFILLSLFWALFSLLCLYDFIRERRWQSPLSMNTAPDIIVWVSQLIFIACVRHFLHRGKDQARSVYSVDEGAWPPSPRKPQSWQKLILNREAVVDLETFALDEARERLMDQILGAVSLPEIAAAGQALDCWLADHPDEPGMADGFELLSHREDFACDTVASSLSPTPGTGNHSRYGSTPDIKETAD